LEGGRDPPTPPTAALGLPLRSTFHCALGLRGLTTPSLRSDRNDAAHCTNPTRHTHTCRFDAVEKNMSERKLHVDALGFGWPSTHSSNAVSLPFAVLRTVYGALWQSCCSVPMFWAYFLAFLYATAVPFSRLVLGVHSAADVQAGMLYGVLHLRLWVVFQLEIGEFMDRATPGFIILAGLALCAVHPRVRPQNYTMEESVCIVAYTMGFLLGKLVGDEHGVTALAGDDAILPHYVLRVIIGFCVVLPLKAAIKELTKVMRTAQGGEGGGKNIDTYNFGFGDFVSRMLQYLLGFGVGTTFFAPFVFKALGI